MRLGLRLIVSLQCPMCDQSLSAEDRKESDSLIAIEGALLGRVQNPHHVCPQCRQIIPSKEAETPEWREKWDQYVKEHSL